jgi:hypothetical protein
LTLDVDSCALSCEQPFDFLQHLKYLERVHAAIVIIIANFKHHYREMKNGENAYT